MKPLIVKSNSHMKWRLVNFREDKGAMQMAIDESMLYARSQNLVPNTLRFYTWTPPAVTIGFFQKIKEEVDIDRVKQEKADLIRRYTGGGAVYHNAEITYSLVISEDDISRDIVSSYEKICSGIVKGLGGLGLEANFYPINDILINQRKISGSAQTRKKGVVLQHGTIILDLELEKMFSFLEVPDEKIKDKMIKSAEERVTSVRNELGRKPEMESIRRHLQEGFAKTFDKSFFESDLSQKELREANKLYKNKYTSFKWNYWR